MNPLWVALAWVLYALLHSLLASLAFKGWVARRWPAAMPGYRLAYNAVALATLAPMAWLILGSDGDWLWRWEGLPAWCANGLALSALLGFAASTRHYDMDEFLGLAQLRARARHVDRAGGFAISPFHRFVRHPWYCFGLVLIWTRDMNPALLVSAVAVTLYFIVGSRLEEKKLLSLHGEAYRRYREHVPGLLPLPWKYLSAAEAAALMQGTRD